MGQRGPKNIFAETPNGELFVWLNAVMNPWVAMCDALPLVYFGKKRKHLYIRIDDAIAWCKKEGEDCRTLKPELDMKSGALEKFKAQVEQERREAQTGGA